MLDSLPRAESATPLLNVGALLDIPTGEYIEDEHGMPVLNGGIGPVHSVAGPGNSYKSEILNYFFGTSMHRYGQYTFDGDTMELLPHENPGAVGIWYDTESSFSYTRLSRPLAQKISKHITGESLDDDEISKHIRFIQGWQINSEEIFAVIRDKSKERFKSRSKGLRTALYNPNKGTYLTMQPPIYAAWDSLSEAKTSANEEKFESKGKIGDSDKTTMFMRDGLAKKMMFTSIPNLSRRGDVFFGMVAHIDKEGPSMDTHAPPPPKLAFSKGGRTTKGVPGSFSFINFLLLEITGTTLMYNSSSDRSSKYPMYESDRHKDCKSLMKANVIVTRNKTGPTGFGLEILMEQGMGVLPHLTEFNYLHTEKKWGMTGNDQKYHLDLYPDCELQRTRIRPLIDSDHKLCRALTFTAELLEISLLWVEEERAKWFTSPKELFDGLTAKGYDWDILLDTRDYWCFKEHEKGLKPYLSTGALTKMLRTDWKPHWYDAAVKAKAAEASTKKEK